MDHEQNRRWQEGEPPFNGRTLETTWMLLPTLRVAIAWTIGRLKRLGAEDLCRVEDWHEHDGYIVSATPWTWADLEQALTSDQSLRESTSDDTYVRSAFFPSSRAWYFRYLVTNDPGDLVDPPDLSVVGTSPVGKLDLTGSMALIEEIERLLKPLVHVEVHDARAFFNSGWGG